MEKVRTIFIYVLASPLIAFYFIAHTYEQVLKVSINQREKLFMKRFNLIDDQHVKDFIIWNTRYVRLRKALD